MRSCLAVSILVRAVTGYILVDCGRDDSVYYLMIAMKKCGRKPEKSAA